MCSWYTFFVHVHYLFLHVSDPQAQSIPQNITLQRLKAKDTSSFPCTLVLCLPSLELNSSHHKKVSFRPKLPVNLQKHSTKDHLKKDTLPWTLHANNMAVYSIHGTQKDSIYYMISPVSCTAVLASAQTSSVTSPVKSSLHHSMPRTHKTGSESHRVPTLGFCVHIDFTPVVVSSSRKQVRITCLLQYCFVCTVIEFFLHAFVVVVVVFVIHLLQFLLIVLLGFLFFICCCCCFC